TAISPGTGPVTGGFSAQFTGRGFGTGTTVTVGGAPVTGMIINSATSLAAFIPAAPGGVSGPFDVVITNSLGTFTLAGGIVYQPTFAAISPAAVPLAGGAVTITGAGFIPGTTVKIGGAALLSPVVASTTTITGTAPAAAAAGPVT